MVLGVVLWTLGGAVVTFVVAAFVWVAILLMLKDNVRRDEKKMLLTLAIGCEEICCKLARRLQPCPQLNKKTITCPVDDILKYIITGNRVLLFIVKKDISGEVKALAAYLQTQVDRYYANEPVDHKQLYRSLRYAVFGVGDTSEARDEFNRLAMQIDMNLRILGASRVVPMRLYDSTTSPVTVEEEFCEWFKSIVPEARLSSGPAVSTQKPIEQQFAMKEILNDPTEEKTLKSVEDEEIDEESFVQEPQLIPIASGNTVPEEYREATREEEEVPAEIGQTEDPDDPSVSATKEAFETTVSWRGSQSITSETSENTPSPQESTDSQPTERHRSRSGSRTSSKDRRKVDSKGRSRSRSRSGGSSRSDRGGSGSKSREDSGHTGAPSGSDESGPDDDWEVMEMPTASDIS